MKNYPNEKWADVTGYEGIYQVSESGLVKSLERTTVYNNRTRHYAEKILKPIPNPKTGYIQYRLTKDGKQELITAHRLVAMAFIPFPCSLIGLPTHKIHVAHLDENIHNNHRSNLKWMSAQENLTHASRAKRKNQTLHNTHPGRIPILQLDPDNTLVHEFQSIADASRATGFSVPTLTNTLKANLNKPHDFKQLGGFIWLYKDNTRRVINNTPKKITQLTIDGKIVARYKSIRQAMTITHINQVGISRTVRNLQKQCGGFMWTLDQ